jgi:hypothetical protein
MRVYKLAIVLLGAFLGWSCAYADNSVGFDVSGGVGTSGGDINGSADFKAADSKNPYEATLSIAHQHTTVGTESRTNQITGGVAHTQDENWDGHMDLTYWKDSINAIHYVGPTGGFTYTWLTGSGVESTPKPTGAAAVDETATQPAPKDEIAAVSFNADLFFYGTEVVASSTTRRVFDPKLNRFITKLVPPRSGTEKVTQFHPNFTVEKPLLDSQATPYVTAGHYFYSKDPATIETLAGRPRFASSANAINGLVGGFLNNNGEVGVRVAFPWDVDSDFRLGVAQEVTDNTWSTTQGITFTRTFLAHVKAKLDWSRTIQTGVSSDLFTGGLTYTF